jgi:hypothetical protein
MGFFSTKDWNIIAIIFERPDLYRVNGNRGKGKEATTMRDGAVQHARTLYCAVFDQKGAFLEGVPGAGKDTIAAPVLKKLIQDLPTNKTVLSVLSALEKGESTKVSKALEWSGYPKPAAPPK